MVADVYSHIIDEDRCINAQRLGGSILLHPRLLTLLKIQSLKLRILPSLKVMKVMQRRYWNGLKIPKLPHCSSSWQKLYKVPPSEERLSLWERFSSFEPLCTVTKHFFFVSKVLKAFLSDVSKFAILFVTSSNFC